MFTCVGWLVTLCDSIWQVTLRSSEMEYYEEICRSTNFKLINHQQQGIYIISNTTRQQQVIRTNPKSPDNVVRGSTLSLFVWWLRDRARNFLNLAPCSAVSNTHNNIWLRALKCETVYSNLPSQLITNSVHLTFCMALLRLSVAWWCNGYGVGLAFRQVTGSIPSRSTIPSSDPGQVANTHVPLSPSSTIWYRPKGGDALRPGR